MAPEYERAFDFWQHWYPVMPLEDLAPDRPNRVTVLGQELVLWQGAGDREAGRCRAALDRCPHRWAPLSEGRLDEATGNLECSYHGWQFDGDGHCVRVPQMADEVSDRDRKNLCATGLPCRIEQDLVWVWPDAATADCAEETPRRLSHQLDRDRGFVWSSVVRDLPYDWQTLVENVADPSHVPFTHHGVQGDRAQGGPIPIKIDESSCDRIVASLNRDRSTTIVFEPPCHLEYEIHIPGGEKQLGLVVYCIPTRPGESRIVAQFPRNFAQKLAQLTPRWIEHLFVRNRVLDGDAILLHEQERFLQRTAAEFKGKRPYKMPASADRLAIEFHAWFTKYCGGRIPWERVGLSGDLGAINPHRHALLDRHRQHVQHCASCRRALKTIQQIRVGLGIVAAVAVAVAVPLPDAQRMALGIPLTAIALLCGAAALALRLKLEPEFYFVDYVHPDH